MMLGLSALAERGLPVSLLLGETEELALAGGESVESGGALESAGFVDGLGVVRVEGVQSLGVGLARLVHVLLLHQRHRVLSLSEFGKAANLFVPVVQVAFVVPQLVELRVVQSFLRPRQIEPVILVQNKRTFDATRRNQQTGRFVRLTVAWFRRKFSLKFVFGNAEVGALKSVGCRLFVFLRVERVAGRVAQDGASDGQRAFLVLAHAHDERLLVRIFRVLGVAHNVAAQELLDTGFLVALQHVEGVSDLAWTPLELSLKRHSLLEASDDLLSRRDVRSYRLWLSIQIFVELELLLLCRAFINALLLRTLFLCSALCPSEALRGRRL